MTNRELKELLSTKDNDFEVRMITECGFAVSDIVQVCVSGDGLVLELRSESILE